MAQFKIQSAMEYLMTYGWAILIIAVVAGVLFESGFFNPGNGTSQFCQLESGFSCANYYMYQNGLLTMSILQTTATPITVTAIGCNTNLTSIGTANVVPPVTLQIGTNATFAVQCYSDRSQFSGQVSQLYSGHLQVNYTDITTGFPQIVFGNVEVKIAK